MALDPKYSRALEEELRNLLAQQAMLNTQVLIPVSPPLAPPGVSQSVPISLPTWPNTINSEAANALARPKLPYEHVPGPILAYRVWAIKLGTGQLWSTGIGNIAWQDGQPRPATCTPVRHRNRPHDPILKGQESVAVSGCECGYWTMRGWEDARQVQSTHYSVIGRAAIWGRVIRHAKGYRSEYAYPYEVYEPRPTMPGFPLAPAWQRELKQISDRYGCPIVPWPEELKVA